MYDDIRSEKSKFFQTWANKKLFNNKMISDLGNELAM